jgi:hypothetical protein
MKRAYKVTFFGPFDQRFAASGQPKHEKLILGTSFSDVECSVAEMQRAGEIDPVLEMVGIYISRKFQVAK